MVNFNPIDSDYVVSWQSDLENTKKAYFLFVINPFTSLPHREELENMRNSALRDSAFHSGVVNANIDIGYDNSCSLRQHALSTAVTFEKCWQPNYLNHPKLLKSLNLLKKPYFQWPKYKTRYAYDICGNTAIRLLCCPGTIPVPESLVYLYCIACPSPRFLYRHTYTTGMFDTLYWLSSLWH